MLLMALWWGQTAISQSGIISWATGISAVTITCFSGAILFGIVEPEDISDEEMSALASRFIVSMVIVGVLSLLVVVLLPYL
jgi:fumarate reductase subunit D